MTPPDNTCPPWCVADHAAEDEGSGRRHRGATVAVAGVIRSSRGRAEPTELLLELHHDDSDGLTWVFLGDGERGGFDLSVETAAHLNQRLAFLLAEPGV